MKSKKKRRVQEELNTSSLPDIVFMILFFFMAIGMFPPPQAKIENDIITAPGVELDDQRNYIHLRVSGDQIQLGYDIIEFDDLTKELSKIKDRNVVILHIDDDTSIGFVKNYIEKAILEAGKTKVSHQVLEEDDEV